MIQKNSDQRVSGKMNLYMNPDHLRKLSVYRENLKMGTSYCTMYPMALNPF
ncbi:hypothetical protein HMPREF9374_2919 [Desmospora sp. 8437]|nr:hypothetical protein HMPREF9374_2919 [Desmospora sp. 8437]